MKKMMLALCAMLIFTGVAGAQTAEVSKKKDVSIMGVYIKKSINESIVNSFDTSMVAVFNRMKRFTVMGYQYRLDTASAVEFINKIKELKKEQVQNDEKLIDAEFGTVVIPAAQMRKLVNSFFVIVPTMEDYSFSVTNYNVKVFQKDKYNAWLKAYRKAHKTYPTSKVTAAERKKGKYYKTEPHAKVTVAMKTSVTIIDADGNLLNIFRSVKKASRSGHVDGLKSMALSAGITAASATVSGLEFWLRNQDVFKLKSKVLQVKGGTILMDLGKDLGIEPGYEFIVQSMTKIGDTGKVLKENSGLVRIKKLGDDYSDAKILLGSPQKDQQLIEAPMMGGRFNIWAGMTMPFFTTDTIKLDIGTDSVSTNFGTIIMPELGLGWSSEVGYAGLFSTYAGIALGNGMWMANLDIGGGYSVILGALSIDLELNLSGAIMSVDMPGTYDGDAGAYGYMGIGIGLRPRVTFSMMLSQNLKLNLFGSFNWYPIVLEGYSFSPTSDSVTAPTLKSSDITKTVGGISVDNLNQALNMTGFSAGLEVTLRH